MKKKLKFPHPPARPNEAPDFSSMHVPPAGLLDVPPLEVKVDDVQNYTSSLIRVFNDDGDAVGPWASYISDLDADALLRGLRDMLKVRTIDKRLMNAQRQGKISIYVQCTGEEAIGCGFQCQLSKGDMNFPTYRQHSLLIAAGYPLEAFMGQIYSNSLDPLEGRQIPTMHSSRDHGFFTISGNLGTQYIQAVGWAMANALSGDGKIAAAWIGDGATATNDFHAALLTASTYQPPVILNIVNNQWAISTNAAVVIGGSQTFAERASGYGIPALRVDGNDYLAVAAVSKWAVERVRSGHGPVAIEWFTYRVAAHSSSDDPSAYRSKEEAQVWPLGDPITRLKEYLIRQNFWSEERHIQEEAEILDHVIEVQKLAEQHGTLVNPKSISPLTMLKGVYAEMPEHLVRQRQELGY